MIETPRYDLTIFKLHFGRLMLKAYTKGEHVVRFEAIVHNTKELHSGRVLERFSEIVGRLAGMAERFCTMLDCVDIGFISDSALEELPRPGQWDHTRGWYRPQPATGARRLLGSSHLGGLPKGVHRP